MTDSSGQVQTGAELAERAETGVAVYREATPEETAALLAQIDAASTVARIEERPKKTVNGYARDWKLWTEYLDGLAETSGVRIADTSVSAGLLSGYIRWLDQEHKASVATLYRRLTGVVTSLRDHGTEVTKAHMADARERIRRIKNEGSRAPRDRGQANPLDAATIRKIVKAAACQHAASKLRDRALILVAFGAAMRSAEVSALNTSAVVVMTDTTKDTMYLRVTVPGVKNRPARTVAIMPGRYEESCPVRSWLMWLDLMRAHRIDTDRDDCPAFCAVTQLGHATGNRLSPDGCRIVITRAAERSGISQRLTGHSARRGMVTEGAKRGARVDKLMKQGGWSPKSESFWSYVDAGTETDDPATAKLGL